jgi:preprotein translocase subunit SecE
MIQYLKDVRAEMRHVSWPTRRQTILYTIVVIAISLATAVYLGVFDYLFSTFVLRIV